MSTFIQKAQSEDRYEADLQPSFRKRSRLKTIFCSKISKGTLILLGIGTLLLMLYVFVFNGIISNDEERIYYCTANEESRIPCGYANITQEKCENMLCCFNALTGMCFHYLPSKYFYEKHDSYYMPSENRSPFKQKMLPKLYLTIQEKTPNKFSLILHDSNVKLSPNSIESKNYFIEESKQKLSVNVLNTKNNDDILNTDKSALIASADYWEWSFKFTDGFLFGLDRNLITLSQNESITRVIYKNKLDHNTSPVFWAYYKEYFYGCVIKHDGPMELQVLASNIIIMRSLVGKKIEIEISMGRTPSEIYKQQVGDIVVPPLWTLGTHNCRDTDSAELNELLKTYTDNRESRFDTDCIHKNLFMALQKPGVSDDDLNSFQATLKDLISSGTRFLLSLPPHIIANEANPLYVVAKEHQILYKYQSGIIYNGSYLSETVVFPDYSDQHVEMFIQALVKWITDKFGIENISGFVLSDNWPQDNSYHNVERDYSSYNSEEFTKHMQYTLPWSLQGSNNRLHLENHNFYGSSQNKSLYSYMNNIPNLKDLVVITPTKNYGETELEIVDNYETSWNNFGLYLSKVLFQSITGNFMVGLPICGDTGNYSKILHETLCLRWYLAAATMPYFLVSSGDPFRDPANLNSKFATKVVDLAMNRRKWFLDYFYTILSRKEPLVRPMYYDYFSNPATLKMDTQYTIGSELIVAQPMSQGMSKLQVYLPPEKGIWYEFWGGAMYVPKKKQQNFVEVDIVETDWVMFVAQGNIVALTEKLQLNLYIALDCSDKNCTASGELNKENNIITFVGNNSLVTIGNLPRDCKYSLGFLKVYGYEGTTGYSNSYDKNINVCDSGISKVINYS